MPTMVSFPPDSFAPGERVGILDPLSSVQTGRDGIPKRRPPDTGRMTFMQRVEPVNIERQLDASLVCQIALKRLLEPLVMHRHNLEALVVNDDLQTSSFVFSRVNLGWPRREEQLKPMPLATILPNGESLYDMPNLESQLIEGTEDAYGDGTVLRQVSRCSQELEVHILSAHHEERRAIRAAFEVNLLAELNDDQTGRRQIVPEYYNRQVRINLIGMDDPDEDSRAQANEHVLVARFQAQVAVVQLVTIPGHIQVPVVNQTVGTGLIDSG